MKPVKIISTLWLSSILGAISTFLLQVVLARTLGSSNYGVYSSSLALITICMTLAGLGVSQYWLKAFGKEGELAVRWWKPTLALVMSSVSIITTVLLIFSLYGPNDNATASMIILLIPFLYAGVAIELRCAQLQLEGRFYLISAWQLVPHSVRLLVVVVLALFVNGFIISLVGVVYLLTSLVFLSCACLGLAKKVNSELKLRQEKHRLDPRKLDSQPTVKSALKETAPFAAALFFQVIYLQSDVVMLKYMVGDVEAGVYGVSYMLFLATSLLPSSIFQKYLLPRYHVWIYTDKKRLLRYCINSSSAIFFVGVFGCVFIWIFGGWFVLALFGDEYSKSLDALNALAAAVPFMFLSFGVGAVLITGENMKLKALGMFFTALLSIALNILLIPRYGGLGAALSTVASYCFLSSFYMFFAAKVFRSEFRPGLKEVL